MTALERGTTSTITFDHKSNYWPPFTHVDSIRAIETKRVENDLSIPIYKKMNCLGEALEIIFVLIIFKKKSCLKNPHVIFFYLIPNKRTLQNAN